MMKKTYTPAPLDTRNIELPKELDELTEEMARNVHEVWAQGRMAEGWSWGEQRDDQRKTHPCLVSYEELPDAEREYDRQTAVQTLKLILKLGFRIRRDRHAEPAEGPVPARVRRIARGVWWAMGGTAFTAVLSLFVLILAPHFEYDSWPVLAAVTLVAVSALCWLGCCCRHLLGLYSESRRQLFETELSLYRASVRREESLQDERTTLARLALQLEAKRKEVELASLDRQLRDLR